MIKQMRQQGAYIVDIATQIGCSERTVRRYLKYPEPPARKTRHKMVKLKPFMDYIDMRLAENVWNRGSTPEPQIFPVVCFLTDYSVVLFHQPAIDHPVKYVGTAFGGLFQAPDITQ